MTRRPLGGPWVGLCRPARGLIALALATLLIAIPTATLAADPPVENDASVRVRDVSAGAEADISASPHAVEARPAPPATPTPEPTPEPRPAPPTNGERLAAFALNYLGYPYVWAGNTPAGFDCSGFTQFVVLNVLGIDIGHGLEGQPAAGAWVDWGAWQPGDLIFFQNTYKAGLSHVGLYLGDGLFIHAENEGTGVVISSIYSSYYGPRYWGAVRVG